MAHKGAFQNTAQQGIYKILLVDDNADLLDVIYEILECKEYQITKARSGEDAIEAVSTKDFDLVITDLNMGKVNGIGVLKKTKELHPETRVMIMTANQDMAFSTEASELGVCDYLFKPFKLDDFTTRVSNCLKVYDRQGERTKPLNARNA